MSCPGYGFENPAGMKLCGECGESERLPLSLQIDVRQLARGGGNPQASTTRGGMPWHGLSQITLEDALVLGCRSFRMDLNC